MAVPREIVDGLESILGIFFSGVRHRNRAAFILTDELVEMACKLRARDDDYRFDMHCTFHTALSAPGVALVTEDLGARVKASRNTRNNMQHQSAAATVDDRHCADAILDSVEVIEYCWPNAGRVMPEWVMCGLRMTWVSSSRASDLVTNDFESRMQSESWRVENRRARVNEQSVELGRRPHWHLALVQSTPTVMRLLDSLGVPASVI